MFNKMLLFTGIYHHHKVRTVDSMLWAIFGLATEAGATLGGIELKSPVDFLRLTDDRMLVPELTNREEIRSLIAQVRERKLWRRALVISRQTTPESMHNRAGESPKGLFPAFRQLAGNEPERIKRRREISDQIWDSAGRPCLRHEVWLDVPKPPAMHESKDMWIKAPGEDHPRTLGDFIPIGKWVELYGMHQWRAHVFCPGQYVTAVGKAAEAVLGQRFGLEFLPVARVYAHDQ